MHRLRIPSSGSPQNVAVSAEASDVVDADDADNVDVSDEGDVGNVDDVSDVDAEVRCDAPDVATSIIDSSLELVRSTAAAIAAGI